MIGYIVGGIFNIAFYGALIGGTFAYLTKPDDAELNQVALQTIGGPITQVPGVSRVASLALDIQIKDWVVLKHGIVTPRGASSDHSRHFVGAFHHWILV